MKYVRFRHNESVKYGILDGDKIREISGSYFDSWYYTGVKYDVSDARFLAPCVPSKVVAVGLNYADHVSEFGNREIPKNPVIFVKLPYTVIGPEEKIIIPAGARRVDFEAELAVVIKKDCYKVSEKEANEYILGATCLNDVTERYIQRLDGQWTRAKNFETFCPLGPCIADGLDYNSLDVKSFLNGELKQSSNTSNLIWNVQQLISFISEFMPLYKGDVVTTGTPSGVGPMKDGDVIEIVIEGVGTLRNPVSAQKDDSKPASTQ